MLSEALFDRLSHAVQDENPLPKDSEKYDWQIEVLERDREMCHYLLKTNWTFFAKGGRVLYTPSECDRTDVTCWFGLTKETVINSLIKIQENETKE